MVAQTSVVLACRLLKQETHEFKTSMGYKASSRLVWARSEVRPYPEKNKDSVSQLQISSWLYFRSLSTAHPPTVTDLPSLQASFPRVLC